MRTAKICLCLMRPRTGPQSWDETSRPGREASRRGEAVCSQRLYFGRLSATAGQTSVALAVVQPPPPRWGHKRSVMLLLSWWIVSHSGLPATGKKVNVRLVNVKYVGMTRLQLWWRGSLWSWWSWSFLSFSLFWYSNSLSFNEDEEDHYRINHFSLCRTAWWNEKDQ